MAHRLRSSGVAAVVPELHRGSLAADTEAVQAAVEALPEPPLLLGHSYGGSVITGVRGARHLVYLAAFVLDAGESAGSGRGVRGTPGRDQARARRIDQPVPRPGRRCPLPRLPRTTRRPGDRPAPPPSPRLRTGVPLQHSWKGTPSTYVVCGQDRAIDPALQRKMASRCTEIRAWGTGHSPFVGQPELVVGFLRELLVAGYRP
ncbi:Alpha/beta hydrolase OS=Streptomyces cyaneofuscatus OX=66883 GN=G3I52_00215 PE=4 SV=1 [Streptomyces cyaneofuscatus]